MAITALPALDRTGATFRADVDTFFDSQLPTFSVEVEAARVAIVAAEATASAAAATATAKEILTNADAIATAADRVQTGLDRTSATNSAAAAAASAAVAAGAAAFVDTNPVVKGSVDATKQVRFEVDGLTTATTRVLTVPDADLTLVGTATAQTLTNKTLTGYTETVYALSGTTPAFSEANGSVQTWTLSGASTPTDSLTTGQSIILVITPGAYSITWPTGTWTKVGGSGAAPTLYSAGKTTVILWKIDSTLYYSHLGDA
jgi:hypothetical protein